MLWKGRRQSDNVEDGRGGGFGRTPGGLGRSPIRMPIGRGGGGSLSGIIILVVLFFVLGPAASTRWKSWPAAAAAGPGGGGQVTESGPPASDEMKQFVSVVLAETEDVWNGVFQAEG